MNLISFLQEGKKLRIGIWGLGIVGRSAINFLHGRGHQLSLCESRNFTAEELVYLEQRNVRMYQQQHDLEAFFNDHDMIIPSGGVDLTPYAAYAHKWLPELDLFQAFSTKPVIAVTGTLGKTTVTHTISQLLERAGKRVLTGGNIGIGLCDLIDQQYGCDFVVMEVSSFQLEQCRFFAPTYALWTNFYPNHLDRHGTLRSYLEAKARIFAYQKNNSCAFIPSEVVSGCLTLPHNATFVCVGLPPAGIKVAYVALQDNIIVFHQDGVATEIAQVPSYGFAANWMIIAALFNELQLPILAQEPIERTSVLAHRIEKVATIAGRDIYNDSKATIMQAVIGAVEQFGNKRVHLLLGGLSKGVDRAPFIAQLPSYVVHIYTFGAEHELLMHAAHAAGLQATGYQDLSQAYVAAFNQSKEDEVILLSPGGSSFDLFKNYQERGGTFTRMVQEHEQLVVQQMQQQSQREQDIF